MRITKAEGVCFGLLKFFMSKLFSKRTKARLYTSIIRPTLIYGCQVRAAVYVTMKSLKTFEKFRGEYVAHL